jgi:uncharacterized protein with PQ loop repeat
MSVLEIISLISAVVMPFFNIPLIMRIIKRRSSEDISLVWALGVWICILLMAPSGFQSKDIVWKTFNITNLVLFSAVVFFVLKFHKKVDRGINE